MPLSFLVLLAAQAASGGDTFFGSLEANIIGALVVAVVVAAVTSFIARRRKSREVKKEDELSANEKLEKVIALAESMHVALIGADATALNPDPPPGLVKDVALIKRTLYENGGKGNTVLDRLDRMEKRTNAGVAAVQRVENRQTEIREAIVGEESPHAQG